MSLLPFLFSGVFFPFSSASFFLFFFLFFCATKMQKRIIMSLYSFSNLSSSSFLLWFYLTSTHSPIGTSAAWQYLFEQISFTVRSPLYSYDPSHVASPTSNSDPTPILNASSPPPLPPSANIHRISSARFIRVISHSTTHHLTRLRYGLRDIVAEALILAPVERDEVRKVVSK